MDVELASASIDRLIDSRHERRVASLDPAEEAWKASEIRHKAKMREQNRRDWQDYFMRLADSLRASAAAFDRKAESLRETKGT